MPAKAAAVYRREGPAGLWFGLLAQTFYRRLLFIERGPDGPESGPAADPSATATRLLGEDEVEQYFLFRPETAMAEIHRRLQSGNRCFVMRQGQDIAHAVWAAEGRVRIDYLSCEIALPPESVYLYDSFTSPPLRGKALAVCNMAEAIGFLGNAGYRRFFAAVLPENRAGVRAARKVGFRPS